MNQKPYKTVHKHHVLDHFSFFKGKDKNRYTYFILGHFQIQSHLLLDEINPNTTIWLAEAASYLLLAHYSVGILGFVYFSQKLRKIRPVPRFGYIFIWWDCVHPLLQRWQQPTDGRTYSALPSTHDMNKPTPDLPCFDLRLRPTPTDSPTIRCSPNDTHPNETPSSAKRSIRHNSFVNVPIRIQFVPIGIKIKLLRWSFFGMEQTHTHTSAYNVLPSSDLRPASRPSVARLGRSWRQRPHRVHGLRRGYQLV